MPELPEVQTTANGLNSTAKGKKILGFWTDYKSHKIPKNFGREIVGRKILRTERRAKNILIHLSGGLTLLVHMKMTGHFVYEKHDYPYVRLYFDLSGNKKLYFSDMRRFAKVALIETDKLHESKHLEGIGPEPLETNFQLTNFNKQLETKPNGKIKTVLMDPSVVAGIGNIYSDEILWRAGVHPESRVSKIPRANISKMFKAMKEVLRKGIDFGGDSMSDYRNIDGERGKYQEHHRAYQLTGERCSKRGCKGSIERLVVGGRSAHFCPTHQIRYN